MGMFDFLKGGKKEKTHATKAPSQVLRENGIDTSNLKFGFGGTGAVTITGTVASEPDIKRITEIIEKLDGVSSVHNQVEIATAPLEAAAAVGNTPEPTPEVSHGDSGEATPGAEKTYTVESGDTLWKIASTHYGSGSDYLKIFEANKDILDDPDKIQVGQVLKIPE